MANPRVEPNNKPATIRLTNLIWRTFDSSLPFEMPRRPKFDNKIELVSISLLQGFRLQLDIDLRKRIPRLVNILERNCVGQRSSWCKQRMVKWGFTAFQPDILKYLHINDNKSSDWDVKIINQSWFMLIKFNERKKVEKSYSTLV